MFGTTTVEVINRNLPKQEYNDMGNLLEHEVS